MKKSGVCLLLLLTTLVSRSQSLSLHFDGANDHVVIPPSAAVMNGGPFTFETWIKPEQTGSEILSIARKDHFFLYLEGMGMGPGMEGMPAEYLIMCDLWSNNYNMLYRAAYQVPADFFGTWHHLAATYSGSHWTLYLDGTPVSTVATSQGINAMAAAPLTLGVYENMWHYAGLMDDLRIWNVARSSSDIAANRNTELPANTPGLVAYYKFNQGIAGGINTGITAITDATATANNGALNNFALTGTTSNFSSGFQQLVILPLHLSTFTATEKNNTVVITWRTAQASHSPFILERSTDGTTFTPIGTVAPGSAGQYHFTDRTPGAGTNIYRLSSASANGTREYSKAVSVRIGNITGLSIYPNPAKDVLQVKCHYSGKEKISVLNMAGHTLLSIDLAFEPAARSVSVPVRISHLPQGIYTIKVGSKTLPFSKL